MIKRYRPDNPLVKPIGIVAPSRGAERNAIQQQRTASNLLNMAYQGAVEEQRAVGQDYAVKIAVRNEKGQVEYQEIPDAFSPVARRTAQTQIDQRYQTALRADISEKAKSFRFDDNGAPVSSQVYENKMAEYINQTARLNDRYANFVTEYSMPLMAQNLADIKHKNYEATMRQDYINMQSDIDSQIADLAATTNSMAGMQETFTEFGDRISLEEALYGQILSNINEFQARHGSRIEGAMVRNMRKNTKLAFYNGKIKRMAGVISAEIQKAGLPPFAKFDAEQAYLNDMISALQSTASYDALPAQRRNQLADIGFTREFVENADMTFQRKQIASELATYQGTRAEQYTNDKIQRQNDLTSFQLNEGVIVSQKSFDTLLDRQGITDGFSALQNISNILDPTSADAIAVNNGLKGDSPMPTAIQQIFENPDVLMAAASQGQLDNVLALWNNLTTKIDPLGRSYTTPRGVSAKGVAMMESLQAYSSVMQTLDMNEFFAKRAEFGRFGADEQKAAIKSALADDYKDIDAFVTDATRIFTPEERMEMRSIAPTLIYAHGVDKAKEILSNTADRLYKKSDFLYGVEGKSMWSPESRYGAEFSIFRDAANDALAEAGDYALGVNTSLIYDRRGGAGFPVYIAVNKDTGIPIMNPDGEMVRVGGLSVLAKRQADYAEQAAIYRQFLDAEQERLNQQLDDVPTDEEAAQIRFN
jgi:hypothetical protein